MPLRRGVDTIAVKNLFNCIFLYYMQRRWSGIQHNQLILNQSIGRYIKFELIWYVEQVLNYFCLL